MGNTRELKLHVLDGIFILRSEVSKTVMPANQKTFLYKQLRRLVNTLVDNENYESLESIQEKEVDLLLGAPLAGFREFKTSFCRLATGVEPERTKNLCQLLQNLINLGASPIGFKKKKLQEASVEYLANKIRHRYGALGPLGSLYD